MKQKPYKTKTSLLWAKQREHFYKQRKETHYKTSLYPGQGKRSKSGNRKLLQNVNNSRNLNGCPVVTNPSVHYEVWHILFWIILCNGVDRWRIRFSNPFPGPNTAVHFSLSIGPRGLKWNINILYGHVIFRKVFPSSGVNIFNTDHG